MAKAKKIVEETPEVTPIIEDTESVVVPDVIEPIVEEPKEEKKAAIKKEVTEKDEVLFLKRILHIQHSGGFGRHLDDIIYDRIKELS
jgi:hypothetical protein